MWEVKAKLDSTSVRNDKYYVTFEVDSFDDRPKSGDTLYKLKLTEWSPPKTLKANAYYWVLVNKLSEALSKESYTSVARIHNQNLRSMWNELLVMVDDSPKLEIIPNTDKAEQEVLEDMDYHMMPVPYSIMANPIFTNSKGKEFRYYFVLRGVRTMTNKEISKLIDICIQNCEGIVETKTPNELLELEGYEKQISSNR